MFFSIHFATLSDTAKISSFIRHVYDQTIAPTYSDEGNTEFYKYITVEAIECRFNQDHWLLKAMDEDNLVGVIEIRKNEHLSMLFVDTDYQRQGIGRKLLAAAIEKITRLTPSQKVLSVHSTPNAVPAYQRLGFQTKSEEQIVNGIRFVIMEKRLN